MILKICANPFPTGSARALPRRGRRGSRRLRAVRVVIARRGLPGSSEEAAEASEITGCNSILLLVDFCFSNCGVVGMILQFWGKSCKVYDHGNNVELYLARQMERGRGERRACWARSLQAADIP